MTDHWDVAALAFNTLGGDIVVNPRLQQLQIVVGTAADTTLPVETQFPGCYYLYLAVTSGNDGPRHDISRNPFYRQCQPLLDMLQSLETRYGSEPADAARHMQAAVGTAREVILRYLAAQAMQLLELATRLRPLADPAVFSSMRSSDIPAVSGIARVEQLAVTLGELLSVQLTPAAPRVCH
jgi:hypothetical protein